MLEAGINYFIYVEGFGNLLRKLDLSADADKYFSSNVLVNKLPYQSLSVPILCRNLYNYVGFNFLVKGVRLLITFELDSFSLDPVEV